MFVNEALHWTAGDDIVWFDIGDKEFRVIPNPEFGASHVGGTKIGVTEGCLSLYNTSVYISSHYAHGACIEIWVMKEYGVKESWSKKFVIEMLLNFSPQYFKPLGIYKNGEPFLHDGEKLVTYNEKSQWFRDVGIDGVPYFDMACTFVGSLVSLESACGRETMSERERRNIKRRTDVKEQELQVS